MIPGCGGCARTRFTNQKFSVLRFSSNAFICDCNYFKDSIPIKRIALTNRWFWLLLYKFALVFGMVAVDGVCKHRVKPHLYITAKPDYYQTWMQLLWTMIVLNNDNVPSINSTFRIQFQCAALSKYGKSFEPLDISWNIAMSRHFTWISSMKSVHLLNAMSISLHSPR